MEILAKNISEILVAEINAINDKVKGLNFLEKLKINVIEKLLLLINEQKFPYLENFDFEKNIEKNIFITIKYTSIVLHKNNGITLPKSSVINFKCSKNLFLIEIQNKNTENTLTK